MFCISYYAYCFLQVTPTHLDVETVKAILSEYKIHNADVCLRCNATADELIDVIEGNRCVTELCSGGESNGAYSLWFI
jgi:hypothetical protein